MFRKKYCRYGMYGCGLFHDLLIYFRACCQSIAATSQTVAAIIKSIAAAMMLQITIGAVFFFLPQNIAPAALRKKIIILSPNVINSLRFTL